MLYFTEPSMKNISIFNARVHNLKNVSVDIPKNKLTIITGLSGSGKSSLAFDTIYAEGQRRYAESLSAYARQFMETQDRPDVEDIKGLSPTIAIEQKNQTSNPRSTVGTSTEIYDYLRILFSRFGVQYDPETNSPVVHFTPGEIMEEVRKEWKKRKNIMILSPLTIQSSVKTEDALALVEQSGYDMIRINNMIMKIHDVRSHIQDMSENHDIAMIVSDGKKIEKHIDQVVEKTLEFSNGFLIILDSETGMERLFTTVPYSTDTKKVFSKIEPKTFSFNSPYGACPRCTGLGFTLDVDTDLVIPNPRLTLAEGAIQPWTRIVGNQNSYQKILEEVAKKYNFSLSMPVQNLPKKVLDILFYGTDGQKYIIDGKAIHFEGVVPYLVQKHAETDSDYVRKEIETYMRESLCPMCKGKRLKPESLHVRIGPYSIADIVEMTIEENLPVFQKEKKSETYIEHFLSKELQALAQPLLKEIALRLSYLIEAGLPYVTLNRSMTTLSGGEAQRVRLSTQLSTGLTDVIYILDEPSIGLHSKDTVKLIETMQHLRDIGNTVIVVEHDRSIIETADFIIDVGPGAGALGGEIIAQGTPAQIEKNPKSITGRYLSGKDEIELPKQYRKGNQKYIEILGATACNLKNLDVKIPLGMFVTVTGVSGSGKSSLIIDILGKALSREFYRAKDEPGAHKKIQGINNIDKVITIDQTPIGRTPRSNPATYTGLFTAIRDLFTNVPEAKMRGYDAGMFSFNVKGGGRCEACSGDGYKTIQMQFLPDVFVECAECQGDRYNKDALDIHYRGKTIADVLKLTVEDAYRFFNDIPAIAEKLRVIRDVGLGYIQLGQPATTLSGGEAQRMKLSTELSRRSTGNTLYILDEPTTGLHFEDIKRLLHVMNQLVDKGNTVLTIEHNLDVIKCADWILDLGPEGGVRGGELVAQGNPRDIMKNKKSITGQYLQEIFKSKNESEKKI